MSFYENFTRTAARTVTHPAYFAAGTFGAFIFGLAGSGDGRTTPVHATQPPQAGQEMAAETALRRQGDALIEQEYRIEMTEKTLAAARENIGKDPASLAASLEALDRYGEKLLALRQQQRESLSLFRSTMLADNRLSEKAANKVYDEVITRADGKDMGMVRDYIAPFTDAMRFRDECGARLSLSGTPAAALSDAQENAWASCARAMNDSHDQINEVAALGHFGGVAGGILGLSLMFSALNGRVTASRRQKPFNDLEDTRRMLRPGK